jgi:hypothetical protein
MVAAQEQTPTNLDKNLVIKNEPIPVSTRPDLLRLNLPNQPQLQEQEQEQEQPEPPEQPEQLMVAEEPQEQATEQEDEQPTSAFVAEFEKFFGVKPDEAVETVNQLLAFRDEMRLMRAWGVSPAEYDKRMEVVRAFYNKLPEEGKDQYNSVEGAIAIWDFLTKTGQAKATSSKPTPQAVSRIKQAALPQPELIKKSDILRMDERTYKANLPKITQAFREGRVIDDV